LEPDLEVRIQDASGRPATSEVSVVIDPNPCEWPLFGVTTIPAVEGWAVFDDLRFGQVAGGYRLAVSSGSSGSFSEPIDVAEQAIPDNGLVLEKTLCAKPNTQRDAESLAYVAASDAFWLADDNSASIFEVDRTTGKYRSQIPAAAFVEAFPASAECEDDDGDPATSCSYVDEFEHVTFDASGGFLYVMNTVNSATAVPVRDRGAIFKLRWRGGACPGCWGFESWQPLPDGEFEGMVSIQGRLYFTLDNRVFEYDYDANRLLSTSAEGDSLPPAYQTNRTIQRLQYDGSRLWTIHGLDLVKEVEWGTGTELASYNLAPFGVRTAKGLEVIGDRLYVLEGEPPNPIYVFRLPAAP